MLIFVLGFFALVIVNVKICLSIFCFDCLCLISSDAIENIGLYFWHEILLKILKCKNEYFPGNLGLIERY